MEVAVRIIGEVAKECPVIVKRAKLTGAVLSPVVRREVDYDLDSILMGRSDEVVKLVAFPKCSSIRLKSRA